MKVSDCCNAPSVYLPYYDCDSIDLGVCPRCKDHCEYWDDGAPRDDGRVEEVIVCGRCGEGTMHCDCKEGPRLPKPFTHLHLLFNGNLRKLWDKNRRLHQ